MAEEDSNTEDWSWGGIWNSVKQTSSRVVDIYKEDLAEFTTTIKEDTSKTLETINQKALSKEKGEGSQDESFLGNLVSSLQGGLSSLVTEHPGEEATGDLDASVFLEDPPHKQAYEGWIANGGVNLELKTDDISEILARDDALRKIHTRLVPSEVSYGDFWRRFYFLQYEQSQKDEHRARLLQRAQAAIQEEEDLGWGDDDDVDNDESSIRKAVEREDEKEKERKSDRTNDGNLPSSPPEHDELGQDSSLADAADSRVDPSHTDVNTQIREAMTAAIHDTPGSIEGENGETKEKEAELGSQTNLVAEEPIDESWEVVSNQEKEEQSDDDWADWE